MSVIHIGLKNCGIAGAWRGNSRNVPEDTEQRTCRIISLPIHNDKTLSSRTKFFRIDVTGTFTCAVHGKQRSANAARN